MKKKSTTIAKKTKQTNVKATKNKNKTNSNKKVKSHKKTTIQDITRDNTEVELYSYVDDDDNDLDLEEITAVVESSVKRSVMGSTKRKLFSEENVYPDNKKVFVVSDIMITSDKLIDKTNLNLFAEIGTSRSKKGIRAIQVLPASRGPNVRLQTELYQWRENLDHLCRAESAND
ncbi:hypothetical protein FQA39_LY12772 [Lamprigera yunnana]|nr:hypothetical protein FQA39_LY12772 [Lamprigera yunnana]